MDSIPGGVGIAKGVSVAAIVGIDVGVLLAVGVRVGVIDGVGVAVRGVRVGGGGVATVVLTEDIVSPDPIVVGVIEVVVHPARVKKTTTINNFSADKNFQSFIISSSDYQ